MQFHCFYLKISYVFTPGWQLIFSHNTALKANVEVITYNVLKKTKQNKKTNQVFPHSFLHSLTLQVYKLFQAIHVAHSYSDKPFSSP